MFLAALAATSAVVCQAQNSSSVAVESMEIPYYPPIAKVATVVGTVHIKVATDGDKVVSAEVIDGPKLLGTTAERNIRTWRFVRSNPATFVVTYTYKLVQEPGDNPNGSTLTLRLPTDVEVISVIPPPIDSGGATSVPATGTLLHESGHVDQPKPQ